MEIQVATVFSGIGAFEFALKRMDIKHRISFACDNDPFVRKSYFNNYDIDEKDWYSDISELTDDVCRKYQKKIHIFVGGSPCQSFSTVGDQNGLEDPRGLLVYEFTRIVGIIQPQIFIYENVKGLLTNDSGKSWKKVTEAFDGLGYKWFHATLNAKDYGIPQNRERLFVIGFKDKRRTFKFPKKIPLLARLDDFRIDRKCSIKTNGSPLVDISSKYELLEKYHISQPNGVDEKYFLSDKVKKYVTSTGTKNYYSKPEMDLEIARPLLSTMHKMHRAGVDNYFTYGEKVRRLTPKECLRLMGFDDTFKIEDVSDLQIYRQAGNSIVVDVLIAIIKELKIRLLRKIE